MTCFLRLQNLYTYFQKIANSFTVKQLILMHLCVRYSLFLHLYNFKCNFNDVGFYFFYINIITLKEEVSKLIS